jgi:hypothetical protein
MFFNWKLSTKRVKAVKYAFSAQDFGAVEEQCNPYVGGGGTCTRRHTCLKHYTASYRYVGGNNHTLSTYMLLSPSSTATVLYSFQLKVPKMRFYWCFAMQDSTVMFILYGHRVEFSNNLLPTQGPATNYKKNMWNVSQVIMAHATKSWWDLR